MARENAQKQDDSADMRDAKNQKTEVALREEEVLAFWEREDIFKKSLEKDAPERKKMGEFVFYDGPPFATGLPHIGSLLSSVVKDVFGRYWTMQGYHVARRWGWDCHGLPIENMIEKELGLKNKKEITELGIDKFNEACRASVLRYAEDWKQYVTRIGRWTEYDDAYKTMDNTFMESVWWFVSEMHKKDQLYEGRKVLLYCPHCETPLSKAEIAMDNSYKDVSEESVYVKFKVTDPASHKLPENTYLLAWTTTPWTLPGNVALAVGENIEYVLVEKNSETLILAKDLLTNVFGDDVPTVSRNIKGKDLLGVQYEPLYAVEKVGTAKKEKAHTVLPADFVTTEEGTGIVHTAVIYGEDDYQLGLKEDLPMVPLLDNAGHFNDDAPALICGQYFKKAEKAIKEDLETRGLMFKKEMYTHSYPHCYRCDTALFYNAITSWFIDVQKIKADMLKTNEEDITWHPEHLKHGRYQHILENAPDWTISRNRFWATALPIWKHAKTGDITVIASLDELRARTKSSGNTYFLMRHGEAESNVAGVPSTDPSLQNPLTQKGREQIEAAIPELKKRNIDLIIASPFQRTKESVEIIAQELGITNIVFDERIGEIRVTEFDGRPISEYHTFLDEAGHWSTRTPKGGESWDDVRKRVGAFLYDIESKYQNKTILVVAHNGPLRMLGAVNHGLALSGTAFDHDTDGKRYGNAEIRELDFVPLPHNREYVLDLHRPYIDEIELVDEDGERLERIPEVIDCWAESGSMPFAAEHYPHAKEDTFTNRFPADFIAEYIAQTRTWFYYMHTVSVLLFGKPSFKNVVTTGNILAGDGAKMSKSKKNYTDPMLNMDAFGADALRYYLASGVVMQAEDMSFKDDELKEVHNRLINILWNSYKFYDLYKGERDATYDAQKSENVLDRWILSRLAELTTEVTKHMNAYDTVRATRPMREFIDDYSTWFVRRSRDRMKSGDDGDRHYALATMQHALKTFAMLSAPVMPFIAESVYQGVEGEAESVHLAAWPDAGEVDEALLTTMSFVRSLVTMGLNMRAQKQINVRKPLASFTVQHSGDTPQYWDACVELLKDELNVKDVRLEKSNQDATSVDFDWEITPSLKMEGEAREFMRHVQAMRKKAGLLPQDQIELLVDTESAGETMLETHRDDIIKTVNAKDISFVENAGDAVSVGEHTFTVTLKR